MIETSALPLSHAAVCRACTGKNVERPERCGLQFRRNVRLVRYDRGVRRRLCGVRRCSQGPFSLFDEPTPRRLRQRRPGATDRRHPAKTRRNSR